MNVTSENKKCNGQEKAPIRSAIASNEWINQWEAAVEKYIQKAA